MLQLNGTLLTLLFKKESFIISLRIWLSIGMMEVKEEKEVHESHRARIYSMTINLLIGLRVNSLGYPSYFDSISDCYVAVGSCRSHLRKRRRLKKANWMSLICAIGQFVRPLVEIKPGEESNAR